MRLRSQQYAETIYDCVNTVGDDNRAKYGALCHRFPLIVRECGLAASFGFLAAKGRSDNGAKALLDHYVSVMDARDADALRQLAIDADIFAYRDLTRKVLVAADWFKRYAEAVLKVEATGADGEEEADDA